MTRKWYATLPHPKMYPHTKFGIPTSKNKGDMDRTRKRDGHTDGRTVRLLYASQSSFGGIKIALKKTNYRIMIVKSIAECSSMLQYFRPLLSYHLSLRPLFSLFLSDRLRQVLMYFNNFVRGVPYLVAK